MSDRVSPLSSRRHFVWAFVIVSVVTALACAFAVWMVYKLAE
jgi:type IV secretory pathway component VirB8